jgi:hypothetical protein
MLGLVIKLLGCDMKYRDFCLLLVAWAGAVRGCRGEGYIPTNPTVKPSYSNPIPAARVLHWMTSYVERFNKVKTYRLCLINTHIDSEN